MPAPKKVAAIVTEYRRWSHADVIVGKMIEGYHYDGIERPNLKVVSMYVDQVPKGDMSQDLAKKFGFKICPSIAEALTLGGPKLAVDGVVIIGEHGHYPENEKGQTLYPRRRFFEETAKVFEKCKQSVPVFSDKHLAAVWSDARWIYDRARELFVPFLTGSSLPVTWRRPALKLPMNCELTGAVQIGYGPLEAYGFHLLEGIQCMVERRRGGETGVKAVTYMTGDDFWKAIEDGKLSKALLEAAIERAPRYAKGAYTDRKGKDYHLYFVEYLDGLNAAVAFLNGFLGDNDGGGFCFATQVKDEEMPRSTQYYTQQPDPFGHFIYLVKAIDSMMQSGHTPYPVERTLLTTGMLDALLTSKKEGGKRIETPHLKIKYTPTDWPFATDPVPPTVKR